MSCGKWGWGGKHTRPQPRAVSANFGVILVELGESEFKVKQDVVTHPVAGHIAPLETRFNGPITDGKLDAIVDRSRQWVVLIASPAISEFRVKGAAGTGHVRKRRVPQRKLGLGDRE